MDRRPPWIPRFDGEFARLTGCGRLCYVTSVVNERRRADDDGGTPWLAALLEPHLDGLGEAARERAERERAEQAAAASLAARAVRHRLDEAELMALIFERLDPTNPRVCEGIEFDRLVVLSEPPAPEPTPDHPAAEAPAIVEVARAPEPPERAVDTRAWIGRSWVDDIRPIPAEVLDRPQLDEAQHALLVRAARRELASLNLRRLARADALAHLDLFVRACRAERVRFCRVIPGKGISSRAEPVIKRAVIEWCSEYAGVLGWAPELDRHAEWGAMILELRSPAR